MLQVGARAEAAESVSGAIARVLGLGESRVAAEAAVWLRCYASSALNDPHNNAVAFVDKRVTVD